MTAPPEPPDGQDDTPPDVSLALLVAVLLLDDLRDHLRDRNVGKPADLALRAMAVAALLRRIRARLEEGTP